MIVNPEIGQPLPIRVIGHRRVRPAPGSHPPSVAADQRSLWWVAIAPIVLGGLVVALSYVAGRHHQGGATGFYWVGQALIWAPSIPCLLARRTDARTRVAVLLAIAGVQAMLVWAYSPEQFRFADEFQHLRTLSDVLRTHHLFTPNSFLPVSPAFPGLEIVTDALMTFTGLPAFTSGIVVDSTSHVLLPLFVFLGLRELTDEDRSASIATLIYSTAPHYGYLEVLFIYSTPALVFFALAFRSLIRVARGRARALTIVLPFVPMVLCHHLTVLIWLFMLVGAVVIVAFTRPSGVTLRLAGLAVVLIAGTVVWIQLMAPSTFGYLDQPAISAIQNFIHPHAAGSPAAVTSYGQPPAWERLTAMVGAGCLLIVSAAGIGLTLWSNATRLVALTALGGIVYPAILFVRLFAPDGGDLASRMLTYAMVLIAYPTAVALSALWDHGLARLGPLIASVVGAVFVAAGIVSGLPPAYERIPGRFHVDAFESGIDERVTQVGRWAHSNIPPHARVLCGFSACSTIGGYSQATISGAGSQIYDAPTVAKLNAAINDQVLSYVETDLRWSQQRPLTGEYWASDSHSGQYTRPLSPAVFQRFDEDPELDRRYDDGAVRAYYTASVWSP